MPVSSSVSCGFVVKMLTILPFSAEMSPSQVNEGMERWIKLDFQRYVCVIEGSGILNFSKNQYTCIMSYQVWSILNVLELLPPRFVTPRSDLSGAGSNSNDGIVDQTFSSTMLRGTILYLIAGNGTGLTFSVYINKFIFWFCLFTEKTCQISVSHIESPGCLYVQHPRRAQALKKIQQRINEHCSVHPPLNDLHNGEWDIPTFVYTDFLLTPQTSYIIGLRSTHHA